MVSPLKSIEYRRKQLSFLRSQGNQQGYAAQYQSGNGHAPAFFLLVGADGAQGDGDAGEQQGAYVFILVDQRGVCQTDGGKQRQDAYDQRRYG